MMATWSVPCSTRAESTGTDTGAETGSSSGGDETSSCGTCEEPGPPLVFLQPMDGATVPSDLTISVEANYACSCDDCGCYEDHPASVILTVDGQELAACFDGCSTVLDVDTQLAPGVHQLEATASYSFHTEVVTISVTVEGDAGTEGSGSGGSGGTSGGSGGTSDGSGSAGGNGGCRVGGEPSLGFAAWLLGLGLLRSRRSRRAH